MICYMNHGRANYDPHTDTATKDIPKGSEVFEDYRIAKNWELVYPWIKDMI